MNRVSGEETLNRGHLETTSRLGFTSNYFTQDQRDGTVQMCPYMWSGCDSVSCRKEKLHLDRETFKHDRRSSDRQYIVVRTPVKIPDHFRCTSRFSVLSSLKLIHFPRPDDSTLTPSIILFSFPFSGTQTVLNTSHLGLGCRVVKGRRRGCPT